MDDSIFSSQFHEMRDAFAREGIAIEVAYTPSGRADYMYEAGRLLARAEVVGRLHLGNCIKLPFPDGSFAATIAINVVHNLDRAECIAAVREIERLSPGRARD